MSAADLATRAAKAFARAAAGDGYMTGQAVSALVRERLGMSDRGRAALAGVDGSPYDVAAVYALRTALRDAIADDSVFARRLAEAVGTSPPPSYAPPRSATPPRHVAAHPVTARSAMARSAMAPQIMPSQVRVAQTLLFVLSVIQAIAAVYAIVYGFSAVDEAQHGSGYRAWNDNTGGDVAQAKGILSVAGVIMLAFPVLAFTVAAKFGRGRAGVRVGAMWAGALNAMLGLLLFVAVAPSFLRVLGFFLLVAGVMIVVLCSRRAAVAWFYGSTY